MQPDWPPMEEIPDLTAEKLQAGIGKASGLDGRTAKELCRAPE